MISIEFIQRQSRWKSTCGSCKNLMIPTLLRESNTVAVTDMYEKLSVKSG